MDPLDQHHDSAINGVKVIPLKKIPDERGMVMHWMRSDAPHFKQFGEVYFSWINSNIVKAWKKHFSTDQNLVVPHGEVEFILYDHRGSSPTYGQIQKVTLGQSNYSLLQIPSHIWYGFVGKAPTPSLIANCATRPHDPKESETLPALNSFIPFSWPSECQII